MNLNLSLAIIGELNFVIAAIIKNMSDIYGTILCSILFLRKENIVKR